MKIKRLITAIMAVFMALIFAGCGKFGIEISELITPPEPTGELYEISRALYEYAGDDITLRYPKSGNWRSAFIVEDIDGDGAEDAIAFYSTLSKENTTVMHINLITKLAGKWVSVSDNAVESSSVESVEFKDLSNDNIPEIIVLWNISTQPTDKVSVYTFGNGGLTQNIHGDCSYYAVCNLDENSDDELVIISNDGIAKLAQATVYSFDRYRVENLGSCSVDPEVTEYYSAVLSKLDSGKPALFIDAAKSTAGTVTEVIYLNERGTPQSLFSDNQTSSNAVTLRASNARSYDVDGDETLEIPLLTQLPSIRGTVESDMVYLTEWYKCNEQEGLIYCSTAFMNYADGYMIKVDEEWKGILTIAKSQDLSERIFYEYDEDVALATHELFRIKTVDKADYEYSSEEYKGYFLIASNEKKVILGKTNSENEWKLTEQEIKNRFKTIV